jgi:hypothetical protein
MILMKAGLESLKKQYPVLEARPLAFPEQENKPQKVLNNESVDGWG